MKTSSFTVFSSSLLFWVTTSFSMISERKNHFLPQDYETSDVFWTPIKEEPVENVVTPAMSTPAPSKQALKAHKWLLKKIEAKRNNNVEQPLKSTSSSSGSKALEAKRKVTETKSTKPSNGPKEVSGAAKKSTNKRPRDENKEADTGKKARIENNQPSSTESKEQAKSVVTPRINLRTFAPRTNVVVPPNPLDMPSLTTKTAAVSAPKVNIHQPVPLMEPRKTTTIASPVDMRDALRKLPPITLRSETEKAAPLQKAPAQRRQTPVFGLASGNRALQQRQSVMASRLNKPLQETPIQPVQELKETQEADKEPKEVKEVVATRPTQTIKRRSSMPVNDNGFDDILSLTDTPIHSAPARLTKPAHIQQPICIKSMLTKTESWDIHHHASPNTARIVVFNLAQNINGKELYRHFGRFGNILSLQIIDDHTYFQRPNFAFIEFELKESATSAVQRMAGMEIEKCKIGVDFSTESFDRHTRILVVKLTEEWKYTPSKELFKLFSIPLNSEKFGPALFSHYNPVKREGIIVFNFAESAIKFKGHLEALEYPLKPYHP